MRIGIPLICLLLCTFLAIGFFFAADLWRRQPAQTKPLDDSEQKESDARKLLAFESLEKRLPQGKPIRPVKALDAASRKRWQILDHNLASAQNQRADMLKALHEKTGADSSWKVPELALVGPRFRRKTSCWTAGAPRKRRINQGSRRISQSPPARVYVGFRRIASFIIITRWGSGTFFIPPASVTSKIASTLPASNHTASAISAYPITRASSAGASSMFSLSAFCRKKCRWSI